MTIDEATRNKRLDEQKGPRHMWPCMAAVYAHLLVALRGVGRIHGYAMAVHGSMTSDFDVVAVPWIEDASDPHELVEAVRVAVDGQIPHNSAPSAKPHGRLAWTIYLGPPGSPHIDLSVMPRRP